jgi:hypothetical protein
MGNLTCKITKIIIRYIEITIGVEWMLIFDDMDIPHVKIDNY